MIINIMLLMSVIGGGNWGENPERRGGRPDRSPMLAQRAVEDSPRWTRAVGDRSDLPPGEGTSELGRIIYMDEN